MKNTLHHTHNHDLISQMYDEGLQFQLAYADMLFDKKTLPDLEWISLLHSVCSKYGTLYIHTDQRSVCEVKAYAQDYGWNFQCWIIWSYNWGGRSPRMWGRKHEDILMFTKDPKKWTFNAGAVSIPKKTLINSTKTMQIPTDVWDMQIVHTTSKEKAAGQGRVWQKPRKLLNRIILASSNPGDVVLDPFCGTGTTCVEAKALGRNYIACDTDKACIRITRDRLREGV